MVLPKSALSVPRWTAVSADLPESLILCECTAARNLSDFLFPHCCSDDERRAIASRVTGVLSDIKMISPGQYYAWGDMERVVQRFFAERRLVTYEMLAGSGLRGVWVSGDQSVAVMLNALDHLAIRALGEGGQLKQTWQVVNALDDVLGKMLDFSYHERLGYLTSSLNMVGSGLTLTVLLHLPALSMLNAIPEAAQRLASKRILLRGIAPGDPRDLSRPEMHVAPLCMSGWAADIEPARRQCLYGDLLGGLAALPERTLGNLFTLTNEDTLGASETEFVYYIEQAVQELVEEEEQSRHKLVRHHKEHLLDCVGRALGIAGGARLLGFGEALQATSLIRLAHALGFVAGIDRSALNMLLMECQNAHLQIMRGVAFDGHALALERARMFHSLFSKARIN